MLSYEYAIYEKCIKIFGNPLPRNEFCFVVSSCILCIEKRLLSIQLKPPTVGTRVLAINSSGIHEVILLEFLRLF